MQKKKKFLHTVDWEHEKINNLHIKRWKINIKLKDMIHHTEYNTVGKVKL